MDNPTTIWPGHEASSVTKGLAGDELHAFISDLYPLCRSITGEGTMETLQKIRQQIPISIMKVPSGTKVFDWEVPKEWNIKAAYIKDPNGQKIVDFADSNLHVVNYSVPIHEQVTLKELKKHLHTIPEHPDWIPYRTSYYKEDWGFCMRHSQYQELKEGLYEVYIESTLSPGHLVYGELVIGGSTTDEVLISTHICHPSLCNDNLSGIAVVTYLAHFLLANSNRYTYRLLFIPGTIGAITWLSLHEKATTNIKHGLIAALLGDSGPFTYKQSRRGNAEIDRVVQYVLDQQPDQHSIRKFSPYGYDERQFCSPGFNLPVGSLTRTPYGEFPEYHTSADNLEFVKAKALGKSLDIYQEVIHVLEQNKYYLNQSPKCEPQLGKRGLYNALGGMNDRENLQMALLWVLNLSDGEHHLLDIALESAIDFKTIVKATEMLKEAQLLKEKQVT